MVCETFSHARSLVHALDGRLRLVVAVALSVVVVALDRPAALGVALAAALAAAAAARLPVGATLRRLRALNLFMLLIVVLLPVTAGGEALFRIGPLAFSRAGLVRAVQIAVKGNAIVLLLTALLSTLEPVDLGRAMQGLRVPGKLVRLYFFTVRYLDVLHHEYQRLRLAMRVRCFRPAMSGHTYRSLGYLVGMLLVRSFDRSERVLAAMKCRGYRGRFLSAHRFAFGRAEAVFAALAAAVLAAMGVLQWR